MKKDYVPRGTAPRSPPAAASKNKSHRAKTRNDPPGLTAFVAISFALHLAAIAAVLLLDSQAPSIISEWIGQTYSKFYAKIAANTAPLFGLATALTAGILIYRNFIYLLCFHRFPCYLAIPAILIGLLVAPPPKLGRLST